MGTSDEDETIAHLLEYNRLAEERLGPFLSGATVQILSSDEEGGNFRSFGSGSLFAVGVRRFLVTAHHLLDGRRLWI